MHFPDWQPAIPLHEIHLDWLSAADVRLALLRLDQIDALISGNKWYKLAPYLRQVAERGLAGVMSLGGAHSNHLHALAAAGQRFGFETVGLLRGEPQRTPTVDDLQAFGMQLHWLGYTGYRQRHQTGFWGPWQTRYPHLLAVDEGGGGLTGALGCAGLPLLLRAGLPALGWDDYDELWAACGTGTTVAGLVLGEGGAHPVVGALAVPFGHGVETNLAGLLPGSTGYRLIDASRGGFARLDATLARFILATEAHTGVPLEPLYTGKLLLALHNEIAAGHVAAGSRIVAVHSGGLQGRRALQERLLSLVASA